MLHTAASVLTGLAILLLFVAAAMALAKWRFLARAARARGKVIALHSDGPAETGGSAQTLRPVVRFTAASRDYVEFTMPVGSSAPRYRIGDSVPVRYNPDRPAESARVESFLGLWFAPALISGLALPMLIIGQGILMWHGANDRDVAELRRNGKIVTGTVMEIDIAPDDKGIGGAPMYVLKVEAEETATGQRLRFVSDAIDADQRNAYAIGDKVVVIFDPADPAQYLVEVQ